jgi:hypothetical protein
MPEFREKNTDPMAVSRAILYDFQAIRGHSMGLAVA